MTQQSVEILIGKLLTDEELREAFEQNAHGVLVWLLRQGLQLSRLEMEALKSINASDLSGLADTIDRRLQKASLRRGHMTHTVHDTDTLPTAPLGTTDMRITRVGFGAWAIGGGGWTFAWGNQDDADSIAAIRRHRAWHQLDRHRGGVRPRSLRGDSCPRAARHPGRRPALRLHQGRPRLGRPQPRRPTAARGRSPERSPGGRGVASAARRRAHRPVPDALARRGRHSTRRLLGHTPAD